jgi:hypothetical protein
MRRDVQCVKSYYDAFAHLASRLILYATRPMRDLFWSIHSEEEVIA